MILINNATKYRVFLRTRFYSKRWWLNFLPSFYATDCYNYPENKIWARSYNIYWLSITLGFMLPKKNVFTPAISLDWLWLIKDD